MGNFRFPDSWNTDPEPATSESISYDINPTLLGKPTPRPDKWWSYMDPWPPPESAPDPTSKPAAQPPGRYAQAPTFGDDAQSDAPLAPTPVQPPRRGAVAQVEPPSNSPDLEKSFQDWDGRLVRLPDGSPIPDPYSENGYLMSPFSDLSDVAAAGRRARKEAIDQTGISAGGAAYNYARSMNANVGQGGTFDYQRRRYALGKDGFTQLRQFRDVANFNVGLYCQQAGLGLDATLMAAGGYAKLFSSNARPGRLHDLDPRTRYYIELGHAIGRSGIYDKAGK